MNWVEIGARIRRQRENFGYTREAFAEKLDITPKFCADIELGNKGMSVQTLCNISSILKVSTDYILFGTSQQDCSLSSMMLQHCTPEEQRYAEEILKTFITQHTKLLESDYQYQFGENFMSFYYQFFSNYTRLGDKRLFCFDSFGHVFVDDYVRWIVAEQESYYKRLAESIDYKKMVLSWMGKDIEAGQERAEKLQELAAYLDSHCEVPIQENERGIVRAMVVQAGLLCLQDNSFLQDWEKMMPKRINPILDSLNLGYVIERPDNSREKRWFVSKKEDK